MNANLVKILSCPYQPNTDLILQIEKQNVTDIIEGRLECNVCGRTFSIIEGIPHLLPDDLMGGAKDFSSRSKWQPGARGWNPDFFSKLISGFKEKGLEQKQEQDSFCLNIGCGEKMEPGINADVYIPKNVPKDFVLASAEYLPFKDNTFDIVKSSYVIEHLINPAEFIKRQIAIARKKVILNTDNSEWFGDAWFRLANNGRIFHDEHCYRWTVEYLKNLLVRLGFKSNVFACNLSPSYVVSALSKLGKIPRIGVWFYRDICAEIFKK